jgi:hypothetical protein
MRLDKELCFKCRADMLKKAGHKFDELERYRMETLWEDGMCLCSNYRGNYTLRKGLPVPFCLVNRKQNPPDGCFYFLEQVVSNT